MGQISPWIVLVSSTSLSLSFHLQRKTIFALASRTNLLWSSGTSQSTKDYLKILLWSIWDHFCLKLSAWLASQTERKTCNSKASSSWSRGCLERMSHLWAVLTEFPSLLSSTMVSTHTPPWFSLLAAFWSESKRQACLSNSLWAKWKCTWLTSLPQHWCKSVFSTHTQCVVCSFTLFVRPATS